MCKVIAVSNQKGGVGKTVTCVNLGIGLAREGKKVLILDTDPQGSLSISLGIDEPDKLDYSLANALINIINDEQVDVKKGIFHHEEGVDVMPGNIELSSLEITLTGVISRETILRGYVNKARELYDFIIIDCMGSCLTGCLFHRRISGLTLRTGHISYIPRQRQWKCSDARRIKL